MLATKTLSACTIHEDGNLTTSMVGFKNGHIRKNLTQNGEPRNIAGKAEKKRKEEEEETNSTWPSRADSSQCRRVDRRPDKYTRVETKENAGA